MQDTITSLPAIGWMLRAPSATGGKVHVTVIVDRFGIVGWGTEDRTYPYTNLQWKVKSYPDAATARQDALNVIMQKEAKGYAMKEAPRQRALVPGDSSWLTLASLAELAANHRGKNSQLAKLAAATINGDPA